MYVDDLGEETGAGEPSPLTWENDGAGEPSDWSRPEAKSDEEDLGCLPDLDPLIQEFLLEGDAPWAGNRTEDNSLWTSLPEPSPQSTNK